MIDFFSFDVEGAETRILRNFPFDRWRFLALCIERPTPELNSLLFRNGYLSVRNSRYDTFYVHESLPASATIRRDPFEQIPAKRLVGLAQLVAAQIDLYTCSSIHRPHDLLSGHSNLYRIGA